MIQVVLLSFIILLRVTWSEIASAAHTSADAKVLLLIVLMHALIVEAHIKMAFSGSSSAVVLPDLIISTLNRLLASRASSAFTEAGEATSRGTAGTSTAGTISVVLSAQ